MPEINVSATVVCVFVAMYFNTTLNRTVTSFLFPYTYLLNLILLRVQCWFSAQSRVAHGVSQETYSYLSASVPFPAAMPVMKHFWFPCPGLLGLHPTASVSPQPGVSKSPEHELRRSGSVALVEMKSCCWAVSLGALVPKLLAQSFLVAHMDFVLSLKLWPQGDPAPFLVPLPLPVHSRVVITS